jgi:hypothetical protein
MFSGKLRLTASRQEHRKCEADRVPFRCTTTQGTKDSIGAFLDLCHPDKQQETQREESIVVSCLDEGSIPSGSTPQKARQLAGLSVFNALLAPKKHSKKSNKTHPSSPKNIKQIMHL